jgi:signal transduction histidine kinase/AmiR/NasT family two-component response regulator
MSAFRNKLTQSGRFFRSRLPSLFQTPPVEVLDVLFTQSRFGIVGGAVNGVVFLTLGSRYYSPTALIVWGTAITFTSIWRLMLLRQWTRRKTLPLDEKRLRLWFLLFEMGVLSAALIWSSLGYYFYDFQFGPASFLCLFFIAGMTAAAAQSFAAWLPTLYSFVVPMIAPLFFRMVSHEDSTFVGMSVVILVYGVAILSIARTISSYLNQVWRTSELNSGLLQEVQEKNRLLAKTNDQLIDSQLDIQLNTDVKSEFLAMMTHEIRTPLNGIKGLTELLSATSLNAQQRELVITLIKSSQHLITIVNDVLDFSKIEAKQLELEHKPFDLRVCVQDSVRLLSPRAREKGVALRVDVSPGVPQVLRGDSARTQQILLNLIGNALKFTEQGEVVVSVGVTALEDSSCSLCLSIKDSGIGIPEDKMDRLFKKFSQVEESTSRRFGGTGLGLVITKGIVDKMGGKIRVESEPGKGTTFHVEIDCAIAASSEIPVNTTEVLTINDKMAQNFPLEILIVDDNEVNLMVAQKFVKRLGYSAETAASGMEAIERSAAKQFDLIFMDISMPGLDGPDTVRNLRRVEAQGQRRTIYALTAHATKKEMDNCVAAGMDGYLTKPLEISGLVRAIQDAYHRKSIRTQNEQGKAA